MYSFLTHDRSKTVEETLDTLRKIVGQSGQGLEGVGELEEMQTIFAANGYHDCIKIDPSVVRGLEYYTGPVFEAALLLMFSMMMGKKLSLALLGVGTL